MALQFFPRAGQVLLCDFSGFKPPEMVKKRPVIVVSPRLPYRSQLAAIVPISLTEPRHGLPYCCRLSKNYHPLEPDDLPSWAKCDMLVNISLERLEAFKIGRRQYASANLTPEDLKAVRWSVLCGLGLDKGIE